MNVGACWHCGQPLPPDPPLAVVAGQAHPVCCNGCRAAAQWIEQLGLNDYYRLRSEPATRAPDPASAQRSAQTWARPELSRHVLRAIDGARSEVLLLVDGIRCAACVWLLERALGAAPGVISIQVNAAARRARLLFDPQRTDLPAILAAFARTGYAALPLDAAALDDARRRESRAALKRLVVAGFGAMQAMMYASAIYFGAVDAIDAPTRALMRWLGLLVATPVVFYAARPFFAGAWRALRARTLGMDVPVALAIAGIYGASVIEALRGGGEVYFDSVSMFVFFLLVGRYLEMRARHRAGDLVDALARLTPTFADRLRDDGHIERIGALELTVGERVQVAQGERVPADGTLESAACQVDESLLTGESAAVSKRRGDGLIGGSVLLEGPAIVRVTRVGADTALAGIAALVARAQAQRPRLAQAGERAAAGFVLRILVLAGVCAIGWSFVDPTRALTATLAVLVVSCPCAFALAVPAALTRALSVLAAHGVFVVRTDAIENLALATHAVFDKTGTLTQARLDLTILQTAAGDEDSKNTALACAAALGRSSQHPVAQALVRAGAHLPAASAEDVRAVAGGGIEGVVAGQRLRLGSPAFALRTDAPPSAFGTFPRMRGKGQPQPQHDAGETAQLAAAKSTQLAAANASPAQRGKEQPEPRQDAGESTQLAAANASPALRGKEQLEPQQGAGESAQLAAAKSTQLAAANASPAQRGKLPDRADGGASETELTPTQSLDALPPSAFGTFPRTRGKEQLEPRQDAGDDTAAHADADADADADAEAEADAVILAQEGKTIAVFHLHETLRAEARAALDALRADGMTVEIASGDAPAKVAAVAQALGITHWQARMHPADKLERLRTLRASGARVLAVGDGVNDAPVLAGADVAVALASGTELAQAAGDVVLDGTHLSALARARAVARETLAVLRQNQRWALFYNLAVVPLGALGYVPPWLAAIGMSASSLFVVLNSLRIGRRLHPAPRAPATDSAYAAA